MHFFILFGIQGDLGSIIIAADMFHPGAAGAADHKATRQQHVPPAFSDGLRLPGEQGLVNLHLARRHDGVGTNLTAHAQHQDIIQHQLLHRHRLLPPVPQRHRLGHGNQGQLLHHPLGADLLHNADPAVDKNNDQKQQVFISAHQRDAGGQCEVEQVEQGQGIVPYNLPHGLGVVAGLYVTKPPRFLLPDLLGGQPHVRIGAQARGILFCHARTGLSYHTVIDYSTALDKYPLRAA